LRYFLVGEHWLRFTQRGWTGDLYGVAHAQPKGMIWLLAALATLPWLPAALVAVGARLKAGRSQAGMGVEPANGSGLRAAAPGKANGVAFSDTLYLLSWALAPALFFTVAGNILVSYVLPSLPAFALLLAGAGVASLQGRARWPTLLACAVVPVGACVALLLNGPAFDNYSQKAMLSKLGAAARPATSAAKPAVIYLYERPDSATFYTQGKAQEIKTDARVYALLAAPSQALVFVPENRVVILREPLASGGWQEVARNAQVRAYRQKRL
jgi:4-amino-4-deoxy-L-arabinose transferase-like glycosyltransferase